MYIYINIYIYIYIGISNVGSPLDLMMAELCIYIYMNSFIYICIHKHIGISTVGSPLDLMMAELSDPGPFRQERKKAVR
jgi:hypothetical protein